MKNLTTIIWIITASFFIPPITTVADTNQNGILDAIYDMRTATISQAVSGHGIAEEQGNNFQLAFHGNRELTPLHLVKFIYSGNDCLWLEYDPNNPKKLASSTLIKNGISVHYCAGPLPATVVIRAFHRTISDPEPLPYEWTYSDLTQIPTLGSDEKKLFEYWLRQPYAKVSKSGSSIDINLNFPLEILKPLNMTNDNYTLKFDMSSGGLLTYYKFMHAGTREGWDEYKYSGVLTTTFRNTNGAYVPMTRNVDLHSEDNGKVTGDWHTQVVFTKFIFDAVSPSELSIAAMQIPVGTLVTDQIRQDRYYYSPDQDQRMLESTTVTTEPSGNR
jgi:hypothetical protein